MKVVIAGGREFTDFVLLTNALDMHLPKEPNTIVSGKARGRIA